MKKYAIISYIFFLIILTGMILLYYRPLLEKTFQPKTKVGLVLNGSAEDGSWSQAHFEALQRVERDLEITLVVKENASSDTAEEMRVFDELAKEGCNIIIANSYDFAESAQLAAAKYPEISFFHCAGGVKLDNLSPFFGRMYQIRYLSGIVAGLQTRTNEIGYVAAYDISEVNRGINAFTLGVRSVNPDATVYVVRSETWKDDEAVENAYLRLREKHNIDVMTMHSDSLRVNELCERDGIWCIGYNRDNSAKFPNTTLTSAVWNWSVFYEPQVMSCMQGKYLSGSYWPGIEGKVVALAPLSGNVDPRAADLVEEARAKMEKGTWDVFYGPVYDNEGILRIDQGENMSDTALLESVDWYAEGVVIDE